ncbi:MAG: hypothetical protein J6C41_03355 [Oscillospiraceae bacterium]|nr:hypothetical protein [Oscillospiraceae bacterium]
MMSPWKLPKTAVFGGKTYDLHTDFREILEIFRYFSDPDLPDCFKWQIALALFYEQKLPAEQEQAAMEYLTLFLSGGRQAPTEGGPRLLDWEQDAPLIIADVNKVSGLEIRAEPYIHWWTFLSWFHAIGEGRLSTVVGIREKRNKGEKLESWEKRFYEENRRLVDLPKAYSRDEIEEQTRLLQLLDRSSTERSDSR